MPELPGNLLRHPMLNAYSRYFAPAQPMALGTRTLNKRKQPDVYAGWPRDPNTELAAKTVAKPRAVFCPKTAAKPRPNTAPKNTTARPLTPGFAAVLKERSDEKSVRQQPLVKSSIHEVYCSAQISTLE